MSLRQPPHGASFSASGGGCGRRRWRLGAGGAERSVPPRTPIATPTAPPPGRSAMPAPRATPIAARRLRRQELYPGGCGCALPVQLQRRHLQVVVDQHRHARLDRRRRGGVHHPAAGVEDAHRRRESRPPTSGQRRACGCGRTRTTPPGGPAPAPAATGRGPGLPGSVRSPAWPWGVRVTVGVPRSLLATTVDLPFEDGVERPAARPGAATPGPCLCRASPRSGWTTRASMSAGLVRSA